MTSFPRLSTIAPGQSFSDVLAHAILESYFDADNPLSLSDVLVLLPTRRSVRALSDAFGRAFRAHHKSSFILPRIEPIGDVDEEDLVLRGTGDVAKAALDIPPAISDLERTFALAALVRQRFEAQGYPPNPERDVAMGKSLGRFLDSSIVEQVSLSELETLVPEEFSAHWQDSLQFLEIVRDHWPSVLEEKGLVDAADRRNRLLAALAARWTAFPPAHPVIAAGSTGSIPATATLLKVITELPRGAVVLPGLDLHMEASTWDALEDSHPQFGLRSLLSQIVAARADVVELGEVTQQAQARRTLINEALRPSAATDGWVDAIKAIDQPAACHGLNFLVARHSGEEATAIALLMRESLETPDHTAALVTPDRTLARRVAAEIRRFGIEVDDSAGTPLHQTPPAHHFETLMNAVESDWSALSVLALLKSPFTRLGRSRGALRAAIDSLETRILRGNHIAPGLAGLSDLIEKARTNPNNKSWADIVTSLIEDLQHAAKPLTSLDGQTTFLGWTNALIESANAFALNAEGSESDLWSGRAGEKLSQVLSDWTSLNGSTGELSCADYAAIFKSLIREHSVRAPAGTHPRLFIWGPLEARLQQADLMILGGLTETVWPMDVGLDPWLSRKMRSDLDLSPPERRIGQSAHDFAQLASAPRVVLSRSEKVDGQPAVPSRWLLRLETLLKGTGIESTATLRLPHALWASTLDHAVEPLAPMNPPAPKPPMEVRPKEFQVTEVETWIRDPYAIYARRILGLRPLDPLTQDLGAADRGTIIHKILEDFGKAHPKLLGANAHDDLIEIGRGHFAKIMDIPDVSAFWWPRFERLAAWFIDQEKERRLDITQILTEQNGSLSFEVEGENYTLNARADRIEIRKDNSGVIVDYKTGGMPKAEECETGLAPQVTLEAAMAREGAFPSSVPTLISALTYIGLRGTREPGEVREMTTSADQTAEWAGDAFDNFCALIKDFQDPNRPYPSQPRPQFLSRWGDYDHLARRQEWSVAVSSGEGATND